MKRVLLLLIGVILLTSIISAEIILNEQPKDLYNLGEVIKINEKIATQMGIENFLSVKLICNGIESEVHKQYISLAAGEEQKIDIAIPLVTSFIGKTTGTCSIKSILGDTYVLTNEFTISDYIYVEASVKETLLSPGDDLIIEGLARKDNGQNAQGFVDVTIIGDDVNNPIARTDTIQNGIIYLNISLPEDAKAGDYLVQLSVYEKDKSNNMSNKGFAESKFSVKQIPTNLEIALEEKEATPGETYEIRGILHDQSGEIIESTVEMKIRNGKDKIIETIEGDSGEALDLAILYNEPVSEWSVSAKSEGLESEATFNIKAKAAVTVELSNQTVIITNVGNIPYNDTVLVKIGEDTQEIQTYIEVDDIQKYALNAPDGEYEIEITHSDDQKVTGRAILTGNAIAVEEIGNLGGILFSSFVWLFMIAVLGFIAFTVYRKGYKKTFLGRILPRRRPKDKSSDKDIASAESFIDSKHPAELSLSIKGHKQNASITCLKVKNQSEIIKNKEAKESIKELFNKVAQLAEESKAAVYENKENIFFIFAPARTKTFNNQKAALELAEKIKSLLDQFNKLAKQKVSFGLGSNFGTIVAKPEKSILRFMSMGTLITVARKLASHSQGDVLLSEDLTNKLRSDIKSEKHTSGSLTYHTVTEVKQKIDNKKFISNFIRKLEKENKEAKEKKE